MLAGKCGSGGPYLLACGSSNPTAHLPLHQLSPTPMHCLCSEGSGGAAAGAGCGGAWRAGPAQVGRERRVSELKPAKSGPDGLSSGAQHGSSPLLQLSPFQGCWPGRLQAAPCIVKPAGGAAAGLRGLAQCRAAQSCARCASHGRAGDTACSRLQCSWLAATGKLCWSSSPQVEDVHPFLLLLCS